MFLKYGMFEKDNNNVFLPINKYYCKSFKEHFYVVSQITWNQY